MTGKGREGEALKKVRPRRPAQKTRAVRPRGEYNPSAHAARKRGAANGGAVLALGEARVAHRHVVRGLRELGGRVADLSETRGRGGHVECYNSARG